MTSAVLKQHTDSVTSLATLTYPLPQQQQQQHEGESADLLMASTDAACKLLLWKRFRKHGNDNSSGEWRLVQTLSFAPKMVEAVSLTFIHTATSSVPLLAVAGVDTLIHLFIELSNGTVCGEERREGGGREEGGEGERRKRGREDEKEGRSSKRRDHLLMSCVFFFVSVC